MGEKLTPQQAQAVYDRGGRLLVSAAAGSGKTKVLVDRLMSRLLDPVDPANLDEFLIITYTKAAAAELRGKIAAKLTEKIAEDPRNRHLQKQMQRLYLTKISTVHGFCSDLLKEYAYYLDLPADFRVADENECRELQEGVLSDLLDQAYENQTEEFEAFVNTQGLGRDDRIVPELILKVYNAAKCHLNPQKWLALCRDAADVAGLQDMSQTVWGQFLIEDLHSYLDCQIRVFTQCVLDADGCEGFEKPALNLKETLVSLQALREAETWDEIVQKKNITYGTLRFPGKKGDPQLAERIKAARDACKAGLAKKLKSFSDRSAQIFADLSLCTQAARGLTDLTEQFSLSYDRMKKAKRVLDFGDLEHRTLDLLLGKNRTTPTAASREIGKRFREILVDEYQDSNAVQDAIFRTLSEEKKNCFMVGDVKQSIYQFRLADPSIFLKKYQEYVPANKAQPGQGRKVLLNANFRSGPEVIEAVNAVFQGAMSPEVGGLSYTASEELREGVPHGLLPDPGVEFYGLDAGEDRYAMESDFVAKKIQQMLLSHTKVRDGDTFRDVRPEDIVILLRSPGSVGAVYQRALENLGIRCVSGGGMDLLATEEVSAFRALLETISNPRQDIPLLSCLMGPVFSFTADDVSAIRTEFQEGCFYDAILKSSQEKAASFREMLGKLREYARTSTLSELLRMCLTLTRLDSIFAAMSGGPARRANLQTFYQLAADFESGGVRDLNEFLTHLEALETQGLQAAGEGGAGCVTIMSIHKSKGLEFPVVFLSALSRDFNTESQRQQILSDKDLGLGLSVADRDTRTRYPSIAKSAISVKTAAEGLSEEMRVLYVAMTRARDRLIMTYAQKNLGDHLKKMALRLDFDGGSLLARDAGCPGQWILMEALRRTEAGQLHAIGAKPQSTRVSQIPWKIQVVEENEDAEAGALQNDRPSTPMPGDAEEVLKKALSFVYPHEAATHAPSKQTATGRKGREKDEEAASQAPEPKNFHRTWREPAFGGGKPEGKAYGTAVHAVMQYLNFSCCGTLEGLQAECARILSQGLLSEEQGKKIDPKRIYPFFETEIGRKLISGTKALREFKFSILDDGSHYGEGLTGEQVLLQGVVDCALLESDGITVLDFKTDYVTEDTIASAAERYRLQLDTYADALHRIYEMPIKGKYLYFFHLNRFVKL